MSSNLTNPIKLRRRCTTILILVIAVVVVLVFVVIVSVVEDSSGVPDGDDDVTTLEEGEHEDEAAEHGILIMCSSCICRERYTEADSILRELCSLVAVVGIVVGSGFSCTGVVTAYR